MHFREKWTSGARRRTGMAYAASAALLVRKAALETPSSPEVIGRTFKLKPTELRAFVKLVGGFSIPMAG